MEKTGTKKIALTVEELFKAKEALDTLLSLPGLPLPKAYWLDKLRKRLIPATKRWQAEYALIMNKYVIEVPATPFIPPNKYGEFKSELGTADWLSSNDEFLGFLKKFEVTSPHSGQKAIPFENKEACDTEINQAYENWSVEIEYMPIEVNVFFMDVLLQIPGEQQTAIVFCLDGLSEEMLFPCNVPKTLN